MMKNLIMGLMLAVVASACSNVPAGYVGIKVNKYGGSKGVDNEVLTPGRYWLTINQELYTFPTFQQNYSWTKSVNEGKALDEAFDFKTREGMDVSFDVGISYHLDTAKIPKIFQRYRSGIDEITHVQLKNAVRDAGNAVCSGMTVEEIYGARKAELFTLLQTKVNTEEGLDGIIVDKIYLIGMRLPTSVQSALNAKIEATQRAQQRENEVAEATAQANKEVAKASGEARARTIVAEAEANANIKVARSVTPALVQYIKAKRWNGIGPIAGAGASTFLDAGVVKQYLHLNEKDGE